MGPHIMMSNAGRAAIRSLYYFVLGGLGGLNGWFAMALISKSMRGPTSVEVLVLQGGILGAFVGLGTGIFDGIAAASFARIWRFGGRSMIVGLFAGAIALPLVQAMYSRLFGSGNSGEEVVEPGLRLLYGIGCWIIFGALIGFGEGLGKGSQIWKGVLGGVLGGATGGGIYETLGRQLFSTASYSEQLTLASALTLLGGFTALSIALVTTALKNAWLVVENGKVAGSEIDISKYVHKELGSRRPGVVGSSPKASIYLPGDSEVLPFHASIGFQDGAPTLSALAEAKERGKVTSVNGRPITSWPLGNGDRLQFGSTTVVYRQTRR